MGAGQRKVDPVTREVIQSSLVSICREMSAITMRTSYSPLFSEGLDFSCALFDSEARLVAQAERSPIHLAAMGFSVEGVLEKIGRNNLEPGDILMHNDPYSGGTHIPDLTIIRPIFYRGSLVMFAVNRGHQIDMGGMTPGSYSHNAVEIYQEGIRFPPVKLYERGKPSRSVFEILKSNIRLPVSTEGDIMAQVSSCERVEPRLVAILDKYGESEFNLAMDEILDYTETKTRKMIDDIPEGKYYFEDFMDNDGVTNRPYKIAVDVEIKGSDAIVDYSKSDPQAEGCINAAKAVTASATYLEFIALTNPFVPINFGCYRPIKIIAPEGSIVNARPPAPCMCGNSETSNRIAESIRGALSEAIPERTSAAGMGCSRQCYGSGINIRTNQYYIWCEYPGGGFGGYANGDGESALKSEMANGGNTPVEVFETKYNWRILRSSLRAGSAGQGKWRGGFGQVRDYELLDPEAELTIINDRVKFAPWGVFGGRKASPAEYVLKRKGKPEIRLPSKISKVKLHAGDKFSLRTPGGGGYGNPLERDPEVVAEEVRNGYISRADATNAYGVVLKKGYVDAAGTNALRKRLRRHK